MTSPAPMPSVPPGPGGRPITRGALVDNGPVILLIVVGIGIVGGFAGWGAGGRDPAWLLAGLAGGLLFSGLAFVLTLRRYRRVEVDLTAHNITAGDVTVPLRQVDRLFIGPAQIGLAGRQGVHLVLGAENKVLCMIYLRGAPLRRIGEEKATLLAEALRHTSAPQALDVVEGLVQTGFLARPGWLALPEKGSAESAVRYFVVGSLPGPPDPAGLSTVARNLGVPVETLRATISGDPRATTEVTRALAEAGVRVELLRGAPEDGAGTDPAVVGSDPASDGTGTGGRSSGGQRPGGQESGATAQGATAGQDPATLVERARAATVLATGRRDLDGVTADDVMLTTFDYLRLVNPAEARSMLDDIAKLKAPARRRLLAGDPGLRQVWERYGPAVDG